MNTMRRLGNLKVHLHSVAFGLILLSGSVAGVVISSDIALGDNAAIDAAALASLNACARSCSVEHCVDGMFRRFPHKEGDSKEQLLSDVQVMCLDDLGDCFKRCWRDN